MVGNLPHKRYKNIMICLGWREHFNILFRMATVEDIEEKKFLKTTSNQININLKIILKN